MKEDILEQLIEDWYVTNSGWFVKHNIKYRPNKNHQDYESKKDSVHSDIDILAYSPKEKINNVHVISCKSWQSGLNLKYLFSIIDSEANYNDKTKAGFQKREEWKQFRELVSDKWIDAFVKKIEEETGQRNFTYRVAATKIIHDKKVNYLEKIQNNEKIKKRFNKYNSEIKNEIIDLKTIINQTLERINDKETPVLEMTEIGRFIQLLEAAGIKIN